jgi:hypothetical protein
MIDPSSLGNLRTSLQRLDLKGPACWRCDCLCLPFHQPELPFLCLRDAFLFRVSLDARHTRNAAGGYEKSLPKKPHFAPTPFFGGIVSTRSVAYRADLAVNAVQSTGARPRHDKVHSIR